MKEPLIVRCDSCEEYYELITQVALLGGGIEKNFFTCPHCKREYIAYCTDAKIRAEQARLKMRYRELNKAKTIRQADKIDAEIRKHSADIKEMMNALKIIVIGKE